MSDPGFAVLRVKLGRHRVLDFKLLGFKLLDFKLLDFRLLLEED
jgi:hypothetical protein